MNRMIESVAFLLGVFRRDVRRLLDLSWSDPETWDAFVEADLRRMCAKEGIDVANPSPFLPVQEATRLYPLGSLQIAEEANSHLSVGLTDQELARGVLIVGSHGAGKTTLAWHLLTDLENQE